MKRLILALLFLALFSGLNAQHSVARQWNEELLSAIRNDFARPTVHARNLFHISAAMYDAWSAYSPESDTYFLAKDNNGFYIPFLLPHLPEDIKAAQEKSISYAAYRLIYHRFQNSPSFDTIVFSIDRLMEELGYDIGIKSTSFQCGAAQLGNYIAKQVIEYGLSDGSNEEDLYENEYYEPYNPSFFVERSGNRTIIDLDRWQPIEFVQFIDQAGNEIGQDSPEFLSPEWGRVYPFSLQEEDARNYFRDGNLYRVYHDPGKPSLIDDTNNIGVDNPYKWGHSMVSVWSSHLDPTDQTLWDISPGSIGNTISYPEEFEEYQEFYNYYEGGDNSKGHALNPFSNLPYEPNIVKRSDYARILAEFWADGPDSETPPGHWFAILNEVMDHPEFERKFMGQGNDLDPLEWDVKSYFILGGAMHDAAVSAWGIKGWYDYIRPVSAIRAMGERGQSTDPSLSSYDTDGLPLIADYIELVDWVDPLAGFSGQNIGKVKIKAWRGPRYVNDPDNDVAGVDWILAEDWWPYQRPTFVTPPFAGYVSGHSTFSRAAAEVLTALTGDPFFPGGMGKFSCPKNEFLVFEDGPSEDITLQWATYRDASDQCSLSRIWGGIHPPIDDIPGRLIGEKIGVDAFNYALPYFTKSEEPVVFEKVNVFPNPTDCGITIDYNLSDILNLQVYQSDGKLVMDMELLLDDFRTYVNLQQLDAGVYIIIATDSNGEIVMDQKLVLL